MGRTAVQPVVLNWPVFVGGHLDQQDVDPDAWRNAPVLYQEPSRWFGEAKVEHYHDVKLVVVPGELAIRFMCLGDGPDEALLRAHHAYAKAALASVGITWRGGDGR